MEENASKIFDAPDAFASAAVLNASGPAAGSSLFVINLCASQAPIANVGKSLPGLEAYRLYQVSRREDGRTRHRLRLGFFTTEADAENVLNSVRASYPTAFTACLCDEDRRFARGFVPEPIAAPVAVATPKIAVVVENKTPVAAPKPAAPVMAKVEPVINLDSTAKHPALKAGAKPAAAQAARPTPPAHDSKLLDEALAAEAAAAKSSAPAKVTKPAVAAPPKVEAPTNLDSTAKHRVVKPATAKAAAKVEPARETAADEFHFIDEDLVAKAPVGMAPPTTPDHATEIELSWDPPALTVSPPQAVVAPAFKTQDVIKAPDRSPSAAMGRSPSAASAGAQERPSAGAQERPPNAAAKPVVKRAAAEPAKPANTAAATSVGPSGRKDVIEKPSNLLATIEFTLESEPAKPAARAASAAPSNEPFRVSKGADIPAISLTLDAEPAKPAVKPNAPAPAAAHTAPAAKPAPAVAKPTPTPAAAAKAPAAPAPTAKATPAPAKPVEAAKPKPAAAPAPAATAPASLAQKLSSLPDLDSTQTIRALTSDELSDDSQEKWFAIQLAVSDQPVNLDAMPRLDIFEAYRLYSVANAGSGKITHCLRIGFFREQVSAEAVCGYLKTFFNSPTVVRISIAEQARFKDAPAPKPSPKADAKVLDLSHARERTAKPVPTVTMAVETPRFDPNATGSFKANATGTHKALTATGTHKALATGSHKAMNATGKHKALNATGTHKALKPSSKSASKTSATGKHKALQSKKSLSEQLLDEAREVELSESGIRKLPKNNSLLSKMFGKRK